jgi:hypothetical protein
VTIRWARLKLWSISCRVRVMDCSIFSSSSVSVRELWRDMLTSRLRGHRPSQKKASPSSPSSPFFFFFSGYLRGESDRVCISQRVPLWWRGLASFHMRHDGKRLRSRISRGESTLPQCHTDISIQSK